MEENLKVETKLGVQLLQLVCKAMTTSDKEEFKNALKEIKIIMKHKFYNE